MKNSIRFSPISTYPEGVKLLESTTRSSIFVVDEPIHQDDRGFLLLNDKLFSPDITPNILIFSDASDILADSRKKKHLIQMIESIQEHTLDKGAYVIVRKGINVYDVSTYARTQEDAVPLVSTDHTKAHEHLYVPKNGYTISLNAIAANMEMEDRATRTRTLLIEGTQ